MLYWILPNTISWTASPVVHWAHSPAHPTHHSFTSIFLIISSSQMMAQRSFFLSNVTFWFCNSSGEKKNGKKRNKTNFGSLSSGCLNLPPSLSRHESYLEALFANMREHLRQTVVLQSEQHNTTRRSARQKKRTAEINTTNAQSEVRIRSIQETVKIS